MNNHKTSYLLTSLLISTLISPLMANAEEAAGPGILENWSCSMKAGKDTDDLMAARDYLVRQADKAGLDLPDSYVWYAYKGGPGVDHIWFNVHQDLQAYAATTTALAGAQEMAGVNERFAAVADCETNVGTVRPVFVGADVSDDDEGGSVFISSNACMLNDGVSEADLADLENHIRGVLSGVDEYSTATLFLGDPMTNGPGGADLYLFAVHDSMIDWAAASQGFQGAPGRGSLVRHFNGMMSCSSALWTAEQVVGN